MAVYLVDFENVSSAGISGIQKLTKDDKVYIFYTANAANMSFAAHMNLLSSAAEVIYYSVASGGKNALDFQLSSFLGYLICQGREKNFCIISNDRGYEYVKNFWEKSGLAADVTISGSPNINRALIPFERPFAAKIRQEEPAETLAETVQTEQNTAAITEKIDAADTASEENADAAKKKGRPKSSGKSTASKPKKSAKEIKNSGDEIPQSLRSCFAKADVTDSNETAEVFELLKKSDGKQHFYRGLLKIFGMERGVEVYKIIRPEYTNLIKLVKE